MSAVTSPLDSKTLIAVFLNRVNRISEELINLSSFSSVMQLITANSYEGDSRALGGGRFVDGFTLLANREGWALPSICSIITPVIHVPP